MTLFKDRKITSHSGLNLPYKIDCDALSAEDWKCLAREAASMLPEFSAVEGIPTGGLKFAEALEAYRTSKGPVLIADDVCTTGNSFIQHRNNRPGMIGVAVFCRYEYPSWVTPMFLTPWAEKREHNVSKART